MTIIGARKYLQGARDSPCYIAAIVTNRDSWLFTIPLAMRLLVGARASTRPTVVLPGPETPIKMTTMAMV